MNSNRRKFIKNTLLGLTGFSILNGLYAWQIEPFNLEFVRIKMPIKNLPSHLVGKTLMQISDIHVGKRFDHNFIIKSFIKAKELNPDFVVYTGDYVSTHKDKVLYKELDDVLAHVVKGSLGTVAILGNHDYGVKWKEPLVANEISDRLRKSGMTVLRNDSIEIEGLNIIGFDDLWAKKLDAKKSLSNFNKDKANIALCHNPDACDLDGWQGYNSWILSGHTHGGQCKPPFLPPPLLPVKNKKYSAGLIDLEDGRTLYINRALGHLWQVRYNVKPEITIFELSTV